MFPECYFRVCYGAAPVSRGEQFLSACMRALFFYSTNSTSQFIAALTNEMTAQ